MTTQPGKIPQRRAIRTGARHRIASPPDADALLALTAAFVKRVGKHERRNADDERAGEEFENAHTHLLAALRYCAGQRQFKVSAWNISWNNTYD